MADEAYVRVLEIVATAESGLVRTATEWGDGPVKTFEPVALGRGASGGGAAATLTRDGRFMEERLMPAPRVFVFGAGHVGTAIARAAEAAGFRVIVIDDRSEYADPARFSEGTAVLSGDVDAALSRYPLTATDAVVIATRGHRNDAVILERVATSPAGYVGLLGSKRKKAVVTKGLTAAGVPPASLERVRVPVGLAIGAVTRLMMGQLVVVARPRSSTDCREVAWLTPAAPRARESVDMYSSAGAGAGAALRDCDAALCWRTIPPSTINALAATESVFATGAVFTTPSAMSRATASGGA